MLGDFQRLKIYGERGWLVPCEIPDALWANFAALVKMGFSQHLVSV
jgi:hypothetical protein